MPSPGLLVLDPGNYIGRLPIQGLDLLFWDSAFLEPNIVRNFRVDGTFKDTFLDMPCCPLLTLSLVLEPPDVITGQESILTIYITNNTDQDMTNVRGVNLALPGSILSATMKDKDDGGFTNGFNPGTLTGATVAPYAIPGSATIGFSGGTLPARATLYVKFCLQMFTSATSGSTLGAVTIPKHAVLGDIEVETGLTYSFSNRAAASVATRVYAPSATPTPTPTGFTPTPTPTGFTPTPTPTPTPTTVRGQPTATALIDFIATDTGGVGAGWYTQAYNSGTMTVASGTTVVCRVRIEKTNNDAYTNLRVRATINSFLISPAFIGTYIAVNPGGSIGGTMVNEGTSGFTLACGGDLSMPTTGGVVYAAFSVLTSNNTGVTVSGSSTYASGSGIVGLNNWFENIGVTYVGSYSKTILITSSPVGTPTPTPTPSSTLAPPAVPVQVVGPLTGSYTIPVGVATAEVVLIGGGANGAPGSPAPGTVGAISAGGNGGDSARLVVVNPTVLPGDVFEYTVAGPGGGGNTTVVHKRGASTLSTWVSFGGFGSPGTTGVAATGYGGFGGSVITSPSLGGAPGANGANGGSGNGNGGGGGGGAPYGGSPGSGGSGGSGSVRIYTNQLSGFGTTIEQHGQTGGPAYTPPSGDGAGGGGGGDAGDGGGD